MIVFFFAGVARWSCSASCGGRAFGGSRSCWTRWSTRRSSSALSLTRRPRRPWWLGSRRSGCRSSAISIAPGVVAVSSVPPAPAPGLFPPPMGAPMGGPFAGGGVGAMGAPVGVGGGFGGARLAGLGGALGHPAGGPPAPPLPPYGGPPAFPLGGGVPFGGAAPGLGAGGALAMPAFLFGGGVGRAC